MTAPAKTTLDKDLKSANTLHSAHQNNQVRLQKLSYAAIFMIVVLGLTITDIIPVGGSYWVIVATLIGTYMAMNIGANDVANTMGPAVGSRTLTIIQALLIAAVFNLIGAAIAGGDVVSTVSKGIIDISVIEDPTIFIWAMIAALLAASFWVNIATYLGAPVSTTHSIVGGVAGAGIAAAGFVALNWPVMARIAASWVISPLMGGVLAALILYAIKVLILYRKDMISAARRWVPILVALMASIFSVYLVMKGLKRIYKVDSTFLAIQAIIVFVGALSILKPMINSASLKITNKRSDIAQLFKIPLICATALLAFAHGANDVSNAVGPLAGVISAVQSGNILTKADAPLWILVIGGLGIAIGIYLFGANLMQAVGKRITKLNIIRAYAVALSAATTVIIASAMGLPVSSTHVAIGGIFGVGFLREYLSNRSPASHTENKGKKEEHHTLDALSKHSQKDQKKATRRKLVRRNYFLTIVAAWIVTVPCAALLGALFFFLLRGMLMP